MTVAKFNKLLDEALSKQAAQQKQFSKEQQESKQENVDPMLNAEQEGEDKPNKPVCNVDADTKESVEEPEKIFQCLNCNFISTDHAAIYKHSIDKYKSPALVCDLGNCAKVYLSMNGFIYHIKQHGVSKPTKCIYCSIPFTSVDTCTCHENGHVPEEKPYQCTPCQKHFKRKNENDRHEKLCPKNPSVGTWCKKCKRFFTGQDKLLSHLRTLHSQQGQLFCENCYNLYKSSSDLKQHTKKRECFS